MFFSWDFKVSNIEARKFVPNCKKSFQSVFYIF